jgi:hypothetical protein
LTTPFVLIVIKTFIRIAVLKLHSVKAANTSVPDWIKKYVKLLKRYLDTLRPKVGREVQADEIFPQED